MGQHPIQTRFDGGEVSQRLSGRFDSDLYKKSLKQSKNFEPLAQGSLRMRSGSFFSNKLNTADARVRTIRIRTSSGTDYMAVLLDRKMNLYAVSGDEVTVPGGGTTPEPVSSQELVTNGSFALADGAGWLSKNFGPNQTASEGVHFTAPDVIDPTTNTPAQLNFAKVTNAVDTFAILYQKITVLAEGYADITFRACANVGNALFVRISTQDPATWADAFAGGDILKTTVGNLKVPTHNGLGDLYPKYPDDFTAVDLGQFSNPNGVIGGLHLMPGTYYLSFQFAVLSGGYVDDASIVIDYIAAGGTDGTPAGLDIPTPWTLNEVEAIQFDTETGRDRTVFVHSAHNPWQLTFVAARNWTFGDIAFAGMPVEWAGVNWPACVQIHGGRTYYAGEPKTKNRVRASRSNDPDNLTLGPNPGDALDFKIATKGAIRWLDSYRTLLAGTDLGHFSITGSTGLPLVGDIQVRPESGYQSAPIQAVKSGEHAIFVTSDLRRVRATLFDLQTDGWAAKDLVFAAEHITAGVIKEIHHVWTPDSTLILLLRDGTCAVCTFEPSENVLAWWTINIGATICSAAPVQGPNGAFLWMAVLRNGAVCLERLSLSEGAEELAYVDSYRKIVATAYVYANGDNGVVLDGFEHLAGLDVQVIWNGIVVPSSVFPRGSSDVGLVKLTDMQTGGESIAGQTVTVGVKYKATAITMPKNTKTGKASSPKIGVIVNESRLAADQRESGRPIAVKRPRRIPSKQPSRGSGRS
jgi:hypothetical protein